MIKGDNHMNIYLTDPETSLTVNNGKLVVSKSGEKFEFPVRVVDEVCISGEADISSKEIYKLAINGIDITFSHGTDVVCQTNSGNFQRQKKQFIQNDDEQFRLALSKKIIYSKIKNQFMFLSEFFDDIEEPDFFDDVLSRNELLGIEGSYARKYFRKLSELFPEDAEFTARKKHPATDPVNSMLSYIYSMIYRKYTLMIQKHGLNPCVGFMHDLKAGHYALASDLMEPFRCEIADRIVYEIFRDNYRKEDFEYKSDGSIRLSDSIRNIVVETFDEYCEKPLKTKNGFSNTIEGKMEEQLCSYINAVEEHNTDLFVPYLKGCA
ncbi:MAG: CRISPR-associated endonuclease Cas1 [Ruminococcus sp.]|nr:CRISPR-associated endonuclease Cas1 [Ruminococcus sp.]